MRKLIRTVHYYSDNTFEEIIPDDTPISADEELHAHITALFSEDAPGPLKVLMAAYIVRSATVNKNKTMHDVVCYISSVADTEIKLILAFISHYFNTDLDGFAQICDNASPLGFKQYLYNRTGMLGHVDVTTILDTYLL